MQRSRLPPKPVDPKVDATKAALIAGSDMDRALLRKALLHGTTPTGATWTTATANLVDALPEPERLFVLAWLRRWVRQDGTLAEERESPRRKTNDTAEAPVMDA